MKVRKSADTSGRVARSLWLLFVLTVASGPVLAQDQDSAGDVPIDPSIWILDFHIEAVRNITLLEGPRQGEVYWCMVYQVENKSSEERSAYISVSAVSDRDKSYTDTLLPEVESAVERKFGQPLWGKTNLQAEQKDRQPGDELYNYTTFKPGEKRRCVAVLHKLDPGPTISRSRCGDCRTTSSS